MNIGIIVFPGSNCDRDVRWATEGCLGVPTSFLWHETTDLDGFDAIVIPGGFSYGDYLRCETHCKYQELFHLYQQKRLKNLKQEQTLQWLHNVNNLHN